MKNKRLFIVKFFLTIVSVFNLVRLFGSTSETSDTYSSQTQITLSKNKKTNKIFVDLNQRIRHSERDFIDSLDNLQSLNIIPSEFELGKNLKVNCKILNSLIEIINENAKNNSHIESFAKKMEKLNYLRIRQIIGTMQENEGTPSSKIVTLTLHEKNKALDVLHDLYSFKNTNNNVNHPFRTIISEISVYLTYIINESEGAISYSNKCATLALFLEKMYMRFMKIKEDNPTCTIESNDIEQLINVLKAYAIKRSTYKKMIIYAAASIMTFVICCLVVEVLITTVRRTAKSAVIGALEGLIERRPNTQNSNAPEDTEIGQLTKRICTIVEGVYNKNPNVLSWINWAIGVKTPPPAAPH